MQLPCSQCANKYRKCCEDKKRRNNVFINMCSEKSKFAIEKEASGL